MIDQVDQALQAWVRSAVNDAEVVLGSPNLLAGKPGVSLYLLALAEPPAAWMNRQPATRVALRYLVTTWAEDEQQAHRLLGQLLREVLAQHGSGHANGVSYELDLTELPPALWGALGIAPRPAFTLCVPLAIEQPAPAKKLVQGPLIVRGAPVISLAGTVVGPQDIPIAGANVELTALQLSTHTDARGRFQLSNIPAEPREIQLQVRAKGQVQRVMVTPPGAEDPPLFIRFDSFETR